VIRAAGILILNKKGQALFLQRGSGGDYPGMWAFPGGRREGDETALQTALRETEEETGLKLKEADLKFWTRTERPQEASPLVTPPQGETVDFTTFLARVEEEDFVPQLNDEHTGYAWADITNPPAPLHPGCAIALRRFSMDDELQVAEAIRDGELVSPQEYGNIFLFALRISGVGTAIRGEKKDADGKVIQKAEVVYRKPADYTSPAFLTRAQGLPVVILHPEEAILDSKQFAERVIGAIMITYLRLDENGEPEPWGVARVYDRDAALSLCNMNLSTSPGVLLGKDVTSITLENGTPVIVEGKPSLLDHLAICERGVWDKGGDPTGVDNIHARGDSDMTIKLTRINGETDAGYAARVAEAQALLDSARKDNVGDDRLAKLMETITGLKTVVTDLKTRVDSEAEAKEKKDAEEKEAKKADAKLRADKFEFPKKDADEKEEERKEKMDAAERALCDAMMEAGEPAEMAADAAKRRRKDAEESIDKEAEKEAKEKKDAQEADKAKKDAQTIAGLQATVAALTDEIKGAVAATAPGARSELLAAQARLDSAFLALGGQCRAPVLGETLHAFRLANLRELQKHSPMFKDKDIGLLAVNDSLLEMAEKQIIADAIVAGENPTDIPKGQLVGRSRKDGGHEFITYSGESAAWMRPIAGPVGQRGTKWVNPNPGARR
jgi:8-oxo-dGTP pyrophosphatase MutT (NUDIX family)